jgi:tRNA/rRNA methyltransferase
MKRVILLRPEGPRNVGMILRITQNFGPCELALVAPERPSILVHPEFVQMSHGAEDGREQILQFDTLQEALADCTTSLGFTARVRDKRKRRDWRTVESEWTEVAEDPEHRLALAFGNEATGLTTEEANLLQELVHIRTAKEHTSLNLAVTVGVVLSDIFTGRRVHQPEPGGKMLNGEGREFLKSRLKTVFAEQVARTPSAAKDITEAIERIFSRAPLENRDARAWHLMLTALGSELSPTELGLKPNPTKDGRRLDALERAQQKGASEAPPVE